MIDYAGRPVRAAGLITGGRIGVEICVAVQPKAVKRAGPDVGRDGKIPVGFRDQRLETPLCLCVYVLLKDEVDPSRFGRPDPEMRASRCDDLGTDRITAWDRLMSHALNSPSKGNAVAAPLQIGMQNRE